MIKQKYFLSSLDDEYLDLVDLLDDLSTVNSDIKFRKKSNYKYSQSERKSKIDDDKFASYSQAIIELEEQKKRLQDKIASFPPLPVLPPPAPLIKISGTVDEISYTKALACFDVGAYTTMQEQLERKRRRDNIGTSVAMVAQVLAGSAPHVGKTDNVWQREKSVYVQGKIDGKPFAGWVETADVRPGEQVMMAAVPDGDGYMIYAIAVPEKNVLYLPPKCRSGNEWRQYKLYFLVCLIFLFPFFTWGGLASGKYINSLGLLLVATFFLGLIFRWSVIRKDNVYWDFFQKIDDVLHLDGYTAMSLWKLKKAEANNKQQD